MSTDSRPIGVFDSGLGGLTVLKALALAFPQESFVYLGDTARLPYGTKSPHVIERYLKQNLNYLSQLRVKAFVVACNSASTVLTQTEIDGTPIYGVIEPGSKSALTHSHNKRIGIMATRTTVAQAAYPKMIHEMDGTAKVYQQACPLLVPLVEEGLEQDPLTNLVVYRYASPLLGHGIDTLILGCTHYPALKQSIQRVVGSSIVVVDSAESITEQLRMDFDSGRLQASDDKLKKPTLNIFTTDTNEWFHQLACRLLSPIECTRLEHVDI